MFTSRLNPFSSETNVFIVVHANGDIFLNGEKVKLSDAVWPDKNSDVRISNDKTGKLAHLWTKGLFGNKGVLAKGRNIEYNLNSKGVIDCTDGRDMPLSLKELAQTLYNELGIEAIEATALKQFVTVTKTKAQTLQEDLDAARSEITGIKADNATLTKDNDTLVKANASLKKKVGKKPAKPAAAAK